MRCDPARDDEIRATIRGPLTAMTAMHMMQPQEAKEAIAFWVEALRPYTPEQIRFGFVTFSRNAGSKYPSPQAIIEAIRKGKLQ